MKQLPQLMFAALAATVLAACGGGGGSSSSPGPNPAVTAFSSGVMKKGSVIVNGVKYDDNPSAPAQVFDDRNRTFAQLDDGMVVKVRGRINDDGVTGVAERVEVENELRGAVTAVGLGNPPTITVGGVVVQTDDSTVRANGLVISNALAGQVVEVHGLRDGATLRATRVEVQSGAGLVDEFKGAIGTVGAASFTVGTVTVTPAAGATYAPTDCSFAALSAGLVVEVHGNFTGANTFSASRIECEDLEDDSNGVRPPANARNELEGYVSGLTSPDNNVSGSFTLNGVTVTFTGSTQIRNGARADLTNGVRVEVDGTRNGNTLTAREISFKQDRIILQGAASNVSNTALIVLGQNVQRNDLTRVSVSGGLVNTARVEVRARLVNGSLIADEIRDAGGGGGGTREIVQARVTTKAANSVTVLGFEFTFNGTEFRDSRGAPEVVLTRDAFLAAVNPSATNGTLVKLRGAPFSFSGTTVTNVEQAELED